MNLIRLFIFLTSISFVFCEKPEINIPDSIKQLNKDNFEDFVLKNKNLLVIFYDYSEDSKIIIEGLGDVISAVEQSNSTGKIAIISSEESGILLSRFFINKLPKIIFFNGDLVNYVEYPNHLTGKEKDPMITFLLSKDSPLYIEFDSTKYENLEKALLAFNLEDNVFASNLPVIVYYGKPDTKRTKAVKDALEILKQKGVSVKAYIIYVKLKSDIGLDVYRLPDPKRPGKIDINPKILYKSPMKIFGLLQWTSVILSIYIESCTRPYVSFRGNEIMYIHETTTSLLTYLKGNNTFDKYGSSNIQYLDHHSMEVLTEIAKNNFFPEDPDKDVMVGLILPGLENEVEKRMGFYRDEHSEKGSYLLKLRNSKFSISNSGTSTKYIIPQQDVFKKNFNHIISDVRQNKYPIFYKYKKLTYSNFSHNINQYLKTPFSPLELNSLTLQEYSNDQEHAFFILFCIQGLKKCDKHIPLWKRLSKNSVLQDKNPSLQIFISIYDVEANDIPFELDTEKVPIIYYLPSGDNKISNRIEYNDYITFGAITQYLEDQIEIYNRKNESVKQENQIKDEL